MKLLRAGAPAPVPAPASRDVSHGDDSCLGRGMCAGPTCSPDWSPDINPSPGGMSSPSMEGFGFQPHLFFIFRLGVSEKVTPVVPPAPSLGCMYLVATCDGRPIPGTMVNGI